MGFGIGSLVEKVCDKVGIDEDWGDAIGLAADGAALYFGVGWAAKAGVGGVLGKALVDTAVTDAFDGAGDFIEDFGEDPMTASQWKDRIRKDGYESFEAAVRNGEVSKDVMADPGMQSMRAEHEEEQAAYRDGLAAISAIEASRTAALRG